MGIFDELGKIVDELTGEKKKNESPLPGYHDVLGNSPPPNRFEPGPEHGDPTHISPDRAKALLDAQGYLAPRTENPFELDVARILDIQKNQPTPFTVIDLTPANVGGTQKSNSPPAGNNFFPASQQTMNAIAEMLGIDAAVLQGSEYTNVNPLGVTYIVNNPGTSFRIERIPQGAVNTALNTAAGSPKIFNVNTQLIPNDVFAETSSGLMLDGLYIQFDANDGPLFLAKPGETYDLQFSALYITAFGSGGRWRVILGNKATIKGKTDSRLLRHDLHLWEGRGIFDNPLIHPTPFTWTYNMVIGSTINKLYSLVCSNLDDGANIVAQANGNYVGKITNKGYKIFWITGINLQLDSSSTGIEAFEINLTKGRGPFGASTGLSQQTYSKYFAKIINLDDNHKNYNLDYDFPQPIRITLCGFDNFKGGFTATGEALVLGFSSNAASPDVPVSRLNITLRGYAINTPQYVFQLNGQSTNFFINQNPIDSMMISFNPYPQDVILQI